jgi:16S rRNA (guanine966-N2)-methyltransferase
MRIIGGSSGGRILQVPKGLGVRPTPDLVKQAVFNSLGARVPGAAVLELFAGTGALSLECLSRGALLAVAVEKANRHARFIRQNLERAGLDPGRFELRVQDAFTAMAQLRAGERQFDLIMADPPYGEKNLNRRSSSLAQKLLDDQNLPALLSQEGLLVLGHARRDTLSLPEIWEEVKQLKHGDSIFRLMRLQDRPFSRQDQ